MQGKNTQTYKNLVLRRTVPYDAGCPLRGHARAPQIRCGLANCT